MLDHESKLSCTMAIAVFMLFWGFLMLGDKNNPWASAAVLALGGLALLEWLLMCLADAVGWLRQRVKARRAAAAAAWLRETSELLEGRITPLE